MLSAILVVVVTRAMHAGDLTMRIFPLTAHTQNFAPTCNDDF